MKDCIFCKIAQHKAAANIVYEDDLVFAFMDIDPITDGHTLVIPKKHIPDIHSLDEKTGSRIMKVSKLLADVIKTEFKFDGIMIMEVNGPFQDVPHFHMHVFGRNKDKDIKINYPPETNKDPKHITKNSIQIKKKCTFKK
jgi:diadenosine tetraphosphate (Ap4A) HIT family hydrolase